MRLWSLHPQYLDPQGLVALWREALLAQAVLHGETRGYRRHPQLERFSGHATPQLAIASYLHAVRAEALARGYAFDPSRIRLAAAPVRLEVTTGQRDYEWQHLMNKLKARSPVLHEKWIDAQPPVLHPMFALRTGPVAPWERP